ncbi:hypothetical protein ACFOZ5_08305 [Marinobacter lacisalsi]|uniref:Uncharacterized protein n=1 Tax=Marinobacter lacisalsi TaxID=475979 RepID=A0ABV8QFD8_9GAMM
MPKYYALIEGVNFTSHIDGDAVNMGFFANLQFEGDFQKNSDVLDVLWLHLKARLHESDLKFTTNQQSYFVVRQLDCLEAFDHSPGFWKGFSTYKIDSVDRIKNKVKFFVNCGLVDLRITKPIYRPVRINEQL